MNKVDRSPFVGRGLHGSTQHYSRQPHECGTRPTLSRASASCRQATTAIAGRFGRRECTREARPVCSGLLTRCRLATSALPHLQRHVTCVFHRSVITHETNTMCSFAASEPNLWVCATSSGGVHAAHSLFANTLSAFDPRRLPGACTRRSSSSCVDLQPLGQTIASSPPEEDHRE